MRKIVKGFWEQVQSRALAANRPIIVLAPMADVTDQVYRELIARYSRMSDHGDTKSGLYGGGPDVMWTEFVSADGLNSLGREVLRHDLVYSDKERPIVAQLFTSNEENMRVAVRLCRELGFDGVDINMGCPVGVIVDQGCGSAMIRTPELAIAIVKAAQEVAGNMPVSVKTRIGYSKVEYEEWLPHLLSCGLPALTIHLRTRSEMSAVPAHWEMFKEIKDFCNSISPETIIIGNGDVNDLIGAVDKYKDKNVQAEGVMIGRGVFGRPWVFDWGRYFDNSMNPILNPEPTLEEKLKIMLEHTRLYIEKLGSIKSFAIMKKHYKAYVSGFDGAKELRISLMEGKDHDEVRQIVNNFLKNNNKI